MKTWTKCLNKRRDVGTGRIPSPSRMVSSETRLEREVGVEDLYAAETLGTKIILVQIPYVIMMRKARKTSKIMTDLVS